MSRIGAGHPPPSVEGTVAEAMIRFPKLADPTMTVGQARAALADDHVHVLLVVDHGVLLAVVERTDLDSAPPELPAREG